eukprot:14776603-Alexandrium_andersonii.AAC.1
MAYMHTYTHYPVYDCGHIETCVYAHTFTHTRISVCTCTYTGAVHYTSTVRTFLSTAAHMVVPAL